MQNVIWVWWHLGNPEVFVRSQGSWRKTDLGSNPASAVYQAVTLSLIFRVTWRKNEEGKWCHQKSTCRIFMNWASSALCLSLLSVLPCGIRCFPITTGPPHLQVWHVFISTSFCAVRALLSFFHSVEGELLWHGGRNIELEAGDQTLNVGSITY